MGASALNLVRHLFRQPDHVGQASSTIEVELLDGDGGIISTAAADTTFWSFYASQAADYAKQHGLGVWAGTSPPDAGTAERNIASWTEFTNWVGTASGSASAMMAAKPITAASVVAAASNPMSAPASVTTTQPLTILGVIKTDLARLWSWVRSKI